MNLLDEPTGEALLTNEAINPLIERLGRLEEQCNAQLGQILRLRTDLSEQKARIKWVEIELIHSLQLSVPIMAEENLKTHKGD